ncbi:MAG: hypothetical protein KatS3mg090_0417 [Patescibacteria group bacterium]|nr:MAG: hypothetical protein KatS3mg090_0417 [Patescibacteria group bacterium]
MGQLISVIIPTLNEEKMLPHLLKDLSKQTSRDLEIIVVDANSEDNTVKNAEKFKKELPLKIITSKRRNLAYQRNLGAKKAKGDFLVFIDADCRVPTGFIKNIFFEIRKTKPLVIFPSFSINTSKVIDKTLFSFTNLGLQTSLKFKMPFASGACLIFEKHFFEFLGGFKVVNKQDKEILFPEDMELTQRVFKSGVTPYFSKKIKFKFSMRRFEREGYLKVLMDYLLISLNTLLGIGDIKIKYKMGGDFYKNLRKNEREKLIKNIKVFVEKINKKIKEKVKI